MSTETISNKTSLRTSINDILLDVSWAQISKKYFGKSRSWLNQKINGVNSNGGKSEITEKEREQLKIALHDLAARINNCADAI